MAEEQILTAADIIQAHNCPGGDAWLISNGYEEHLNKYLSSVDQGVTWDPNDMSNVPLTPVASTLEAGMRKTLDVPLPDDDEDLPPYEEWSHDDLVAECEARELSTEGSDEDMALRLMQYDESADAAAGGEQPNVQADYDLLKRSELQQILKHRGLPADGKNDELIARIKEDDARKSSG